MQSLHSSLPHLRRAPAGEPSRLLLVDDEPLVRRWVTRVLCDCGYQVDAVDDGVAAVSALGRQAYDLVLSDITMPRLDGLGVLAAAVQHDPTLPVVLMTGAPPQGVVLKLRELGAVQLLTKPMPLEAVAECVGRWVRLNHAQRLSRRLRQLGFGEAPQASRTVADVQLVLQALNLTQVTPQRARWASEIVTVGPNALIPEAVLLDPELVRAIDTAPEPLAIARALAQHCADLALPLVALGVQTPMEHRALCDAGCGLFHPQP